MANQTSPRSAKQFLLALAGWTLAAMLAWQVLWGSTQALNQLNLALGNSALTYQDLFQSNLSLDYHLVEFIQNETPSTAVLLLDQRWVRTHALFFFYPRQLFFGDAQTLREHPEIDYVIVRGGYPDFPVDGERKWLDDAQGIIKVRR